ncbi:S9 family peptidase [Sediminibacterium roseum]|uniref:S9 family peptidase n=1 Tax=Sediminibacterium roseum TaxID=1978412 RepID=A0ABX0A1R9_9BACT|nr:prolyl oligopeptidase family serine peptidase [Sediminibacterium roseum]NCI51338.1 S9 family peptidase [Sediminibacterium roseum]
MRTQLTRIVILFVIGLLPFVTSGQIKKVVDSSAVVRWPWVSKDVLLSNDGRYVAYTISNGQRRTSTYLKNFDNRRILEIDNEKLISFSNSSRYLLFERGDSIFTLDLVNDFKLTYVGSATYRQPMSCRSDKWLCFFEPKKSLILYDIDEGRKFEFQQVIAYNLCKNQSSLLLIDSSKTLSLINLPSQTRRIIYRGADSVTNVSNLIANDSGDKIAFITSGTLPFQSDDKSIYYYSSSRGLKRLYSDNKNQQYVLGDLFGFTNDGEYLKLTLKYKKTAKVNTPEKGNPRLDLWSYTDTFLQSKRINEGATLQRNVFEARLNIDENSMINLVPKIGDAVEAYPWKIGDYYLVKNDTQGDRFWLKDIDSLFLVSMKTGQRQPFLKGALSSFVFSPDGRFLLYYDGKLQHFCSYEISSRRIRVLTESLTPGAFANDFEFKLTENGKMVVVDDRSAGIAGWNPDDGSLVVYDQFDLWSLDPSGLRSPTCLTKKFGRGNMIKFRLIAATSKDSFLELESHKLYLVALNNLNKENGIFCLDLTSGTSPQSLFMGNYTIYTEPFQNTGRHYDQGMKPLKAKDSDRWVIMLQSCQKSPNLFSTSNFVTFDTLTTIYPEQNYKWLKSELMRFKLEGGIASQGVLYKPDNFDSSKKYPLIFIIYEQFSTSLNEYIRPEFSNGMINIPWFVSQGYLVFTPDIHFRVGEIGKSALRTVESAVAVLKSYKFVDQTRLGLVGHSFSGQMVYHIVSHTQLFSAAIAGAGVSDMVSGSLSLSGYGLNKKASRLPNAESRLNTSLWADRKRYIEESPILFADKIQAPLLIFHSQIDGGVPWEQGIEMFVAMRRLGKPSWMLNYRSSGHIVGGLEAVDFTKRVEQFFDHYLKDSPPPRWIISGTNTWSNFSDEFELVPTKK